MNESETPTRPAMVRVVQLPEVSTGADDAAATPLKLATHPLHQVKTQVQACVGVATLTVGELLSAAENQVLMLNRRLDEPIDLLVEGRVVARGQLVAVDDCFAIRITEAPLPLGASGDTK